MNFKRFLATVACSLAIVGPATAGIVYSYDVGNFGFTYTSPGLYPRQISAANMDRCDFGAGITCTSVGIYDNWFYVRATDAAAADPNEVVTIIDVGGCPPYFAVGQVVPTSSCSVFVSVEKYRPLSLGTLTLVESAAVPEPGSLALVALAAGALAWTRRRYGRGL